MSFDKEKVRRQAEKNLTHGKIQAAIRDYSQIAEHDPKDYNTLNTLGDLYARVNAQDKAISCFKRIAEHYDGQGFTHKAIAMYKKMLRLMPGSVEISAKLAPLYQTLGLVSEARTFYLVVAEDIQKKGEQLKALEVWSRIADLDPNDTATRLKLAENYRREKQTEKAAEAFAEAGSRLLAKKQSEEALYAFNQALELAPFDLPALSGFANASIALGFPDEAVGQLEKAFAVHPENPEILSLLATVHSESGNVGRAEFYIGKLVEREPSGFARYLDAVKLYLKDNNVPEAARVLGLSGEMFISNNREDELLGWLNEVLARDPEQITALRLLARVRAWQRNEDELKVALERLAESAQLNGEEAEERSALAELATLFPEDERYSQRLREIDNQNPAMAPIHTSYPPQTETVPTFESFNSFDEEVAPHYSAPNHAAPTFESPSDYETNNWHNQTVEPTEIPQYSDGYSANPFAAQYANQTAFEVETSPANHYEFDANNGQTIASHADFGFEANNFGAAPLVNPTTEFSFEPTAAARPNSEFAIDASNRQTAAAPNQPAAASQLVVELEGVDFYIAQNLNDIALESLAQLETQFGAHPEIEKRKQQLNPTAEVHAIAAENVFAATEISATTNGNQQTENSFAAAENNFVVEQFAAEQNDFAVAENNFVADSPNVETPISTPAPVFAEPSFANVTTAANGFEDLFAEFGDDLEVANLSTAQTADFETHYNLGLAYKDMGLLDDAVEEFQNAVKMVRAGDGTPRHLQCCHLIGHCFMEKAMPKLAVIWFQRGIDSPGLSDEEYQALRYELGVAYETAGEKARALELFAGIYAVNVAYRSVGEKVRVLQTA